MEGRAQSVLLTPPPLPCSRLPPPAAARAVSAPAFQLTPWMIPAHPCLPSTSNHCPHCSHTDLSKSRAYNALPCLKPSKPALGTKFKFLKWPIRSFFSFSRPALLSTYLLTYLLPFTGTYSPIPAPRSPAYNFQVSTLMPHFCKSCI